ncbi:MAG: thioredoxin family protein [Pirellulaceae bacterium]
MRSHTHIALTVWFVVATGTSLAAQDRIPWITDLQMARQMAEQQQRLVLLHFYADSCAPCQRLERYVFNQPEVIRSMTTGYIPVKINAKQTPQLVDFYKVQSWPTDVVVDPTGKEIYRSISPQDANRYIAMLDGVKAHQSVGMSPSGALSSQLVTPSQTASGGNSRLALDYSPRSSDYQSNQPWRGAAPQGAAGQGAAPPQSSLVDNPYSNPLGRELPQQPASNIAPRYANPYAAHAAQAASTSPWQAPRQQAVGAAMPNPGLQPPQGPAAPGSSFQGGGQIGQPARSEWNAPSANRGGANRSGIPTWQQNAAPANTTWQNHAGRTNPAPSTAPAANERIASRPAPQFQAPPGTHPPIALDGYCPVTLASKTKWAKGDPRWGAVHRGRTYLFSSPSDQQHFLANPDTLSPILSGYDLVRFAETGQLVEGKRQHGVFYRDRICLFADEAALHQFSKQPDRYVATATQAMQRSDNSMPAQ